MGDDAGNSNFSMCLKKAVFFLRVREFSGIKSGEGVSFTVSIPKCCSVAAITCPMTITSRKSSLDLTSLCGSLGTLVQL